MEKDSTVNSILCIADRQAGPRSLCLRPGAGGRLTHNGSIFICNINPVAQRVETFVLCIKPYK